MNIIENGIIIGIFGQVPPGSTHVIQAIHTRKISPVISFPLKLRQTIFKCFISGSLLIQVQREEDKYCNSYLHNFLIK